MDDHHDARGKKMETKNEGEKIRHAPGRPLMHERARIWNLECVLDTKDLSMNKRLDSKDVD